MVSFIYIMDNVVLCGNLSISCGSGRAAGDKDFPAADGEGSERLDAGACAEEDRTVFPAGTTEKRNDGMIIE